MSRSSAQRVTAIVLTLNEAEFLRDCLRSLKVLTSDIIVFDSGSTDTTISIALQEGARIETRTFDGYANQRNAALTLPNLGEWALFLDADERLSPSGAVEMSRELRRATHSIAAFAFPRENIFIGRTLQGGGWSPDFQTRLLRVGRAHYDVRQQVHEYVVVRGQRRALAEPVVHLNYASWPEFRAKQRSYSAAHAADRLRTGNVPRRRAYVSSPLRELKRRLITLHGHRDGLLGLRVALAMAREEVRVCWLTRHAQTGNR